MKKSFTLMAAMAVAIGAFAQIEKANINPEALGLSSEASEVTEGTILCESANVKMSAAFTDNAKTNSVSLNECTGGYVNGEFCTSEGGIQGSSNPNPSVETAPTEGWVMRFDVQKAGYIVAFTKLSSNKNYYVHEGLSGQGEQCVAYTAGILWNTEVNIKDYPDAARTPYLIEMPADEMGYIDLNAADIDKYVNLETGATQQLRYILTGDSETSLTGDGYGFMMFPVYPGVPYLMCAQGSKMTVCGYVFIPSDNDEDASPAKPTAIACGTDAEILYTFFNNEGGVNDIISDVNVDENAPIFNVMGQRVSKDAKGILIQNGKKFYNR